MDLSAVAGSPAFLALQTLATPGAPASSAAALAAETSKTSLIPSTPSQTIGVGAGAGAYAVNQGIGHALSAADAASSAGQTVLGLLAQMHQAAAQATDPDLATSARQSLDQGFQAKVSAIAPALRAASVGGTNLVDGSLSAPLKAALGDGAQASLTALDLTAAGSTLALAGVALSTSQAAAAAQTTVGAATRAATAALDGLQGEAGALAAHAAVLQSLGQAGAVPSTDDSGDGARLLALQVSQQLSAQPATAIANAAPQQVLALFRS